jgi:hypothetical protein
MDYSIFNPESTAAIQDVVAVPEAVADAANDDADAVADVTSAYSPTLAGACDYPGCTFAHVSPTQLGKHKWFAHGIPGKKSLVGQARRAQGITELSKAERSRIAQKAQQKRARKLAAKKLAAATTAATPVPTSGKRAYGVRPALPEGQYYITQKKAAKLLAKRGRLYPGAVVWPPLPSSAKAAKPPAAKPKQYYSSTAQYKAQWRGKKAAEQAQRHQRAMAAPAPSNSTIHPTHQGASSYASTIPPSFVAYTVGKLENELYHIAEVANLPAKQFARECAEYLFSTTRG